MQPLDNQILIALDNSGLENYKVCVHLFGVTSCRTITNNNDKIFHFTINPQLQQGMYMAKGELKDNADNVLSTAELQAARMDFSFLAYLSC